MKSRIVLLLVVLVTCLLTSTEAATWKFYNWNKYQKLAINQGAAWEKVWGIPKHSGWLWYWKGADKTKNVAVRDPTKKTKDLVLRVTYPAGSRNPESRIAGGLGFLAQPLKISKNAKTVTFQYSVYFPKGFKFVRGGKLPGLYGGHGECTGGTDSSGCFTTRYVFTFVILSNCKCSTKSINNFIII
jgi:hypothetical protein